MIFNYNNISSPDGYGSPKERFLKRGSRTNLPNTFRKNLKTEDLIQIRSSKQQKLAEKKGRQSSDKFEVGDHVRVQCPKSRRWRLKREIKKAREGYDVKNVSFVVRMDNGNKSICHKSHIKHDIGSNDRTDEVKVKFDDSISYSDDDTSNSTPSDFVMTQGQARRESLKSSLKPSSHSDSPLPDSLVMGCTIQVHS